MMNETGFIYNAVSIEVKIMKCKNYIEAYQNAIDNMPDEINKEWVKVLRYEAKITEWQMELEKWLNHQSIKSL